MVPAVVLAGGLGTRIRPVSGDRPKSLLPIAGRPFLDYLLLFLARQQVRHVVLAVSHGAPAVRAHVGDGWAFGLEVEYSSDPEPLGTGGALRLAAPRVAGGTLLVLNGDSFVDVDFAGMLERHRLRRAALSVATASVADAGRYGKLRLDEQGRILAFQEKADGGPGVVNAGVYVLERGVIEVIPKGASSLERDTLAPFRGAAYAFMTDGLFVDIGTPEAYRRLAADPRALIRAAGLNGEGQWPSR